MNSPLISIIIPTYNQAHFLKECLDSIRAQSYDRWEAIVINNYSTDNTIAVIESCQDERIRTINFHNNGVIAASRNQGLRDARGEYIAFLDSDDIWLPHKLESQTELLGKHPSVQLVSTNASIIDEKSIATGKKVLPLAWHNHTVRFTDLLRKGCIVTSSVLMRRQVFSETGFMDERPELRAIEDYQYWLRVSKRYPRGIFLMKNSLIRYRVHQKSASSIEFSSPNDYPDKLKLVYSTYQQEYPDLVRAAQRRLVVYQYKNAVYRGLYSLKDILIAHNNLSVYERLLILSTVLVRKVLHI
jgi:glycosyltransferase involved in cell wall biosynthesis